MQTLSIKMLYVLLSMIAGSVPLWAAAGKTQSVTCSFADGEGMRIDYVSAPYELKDKPYELKDNKIWTPGNQPAALFLDTRVSIEGTGLPAGAYGLYLFPQKKQWTLIVNRTAARPSEYNPKGDIIRATMGSSDFGHKVDPQIVLVHISSSQCNIRVYAGSTLAWKEIKEEGK